MPNREYLERYAFEILGVRYFVKGENMQSLAERIDVEKMIQQSLDEREALYMQLNDIQPTTADHWSLPDAQQAMVRQQIGRR